MTYTEIRKNEEVCALLEKGNQNLGVLYHCQGIVARKYNSVETLLYQRIYHGSRPQENE